MQGLFATAAGDDVERCNERVDELNDEIMKMVGGRETRGRQADSDTGTQEHRHVGTLACRHTETDRLARHVHADRDVAASRCAPCRSAKR